MAKYASFCFIMSPFNHFTACMSDFSGTHENTARVSAGIICQISKFVLHIVHSHPPACSILPCMA